MITRYIDAVMLPMLSSERKQPLMMSEIPKSGFLGNKNIYKTVLNGPLQLNRTKYVTTFKQDCFASLVF